jgi:hypothetical protein
VAFASGEKIRASRLNRIQPVSYLANANGDVPALSTDVDVPGATITLTTLAANAVYVAVAFFDFDLTGASTATGTGKLVVDGATQTATANMAGEVTTDRMTPGQTWKGTLASAGSHTLKLTATTGASQIVQDTHTTLQVTIYEVV